MKSLRILLTSLALSICAASASATGIPTVDVGTIAQLQQQYITLKQQYEALTGNGGYGSMGYNQAITSATVVPGSWQDVVARQATGAYGTTLNYYESRINTLPSDRFSDSSALSTQTYNMSSDAVRSSLAGGDNLYSEVQTHLNNIAILGHKIDETENIKEAQDLQNRLAAENAMLQTASAKLQALSLNLQANMLNRQNQAQAANELFYQWDVE